MLRCFLSFHRISTACWLCCWPIATLNSIGHGSATHSEMLVVRHDFSVKKQADNLWPKVVRSREAEQILNVAPTTLNELTNSGRLRGRLIDRPGVQRHWEFKLADVLALRDSGAVVKHHQRPRKQIALWHKYFGAIPNGLTPAFRDGDRTNDSPTNLCLLPLRSSHRVITNGEKRDRGTIVQWTAEMKRRLRRDFKNTPSDDLASQLGVTTPALRCQARKLRLRKSSKYLKSKRTFQLPVGTERLHESTGIIWTKVSLDGNRHCERWRPKQHLIWEESTGQQVPANHVVLFKDGNKQNFDSNNLELISRREMSARGFARFATFPQSLQRAIKQAGRLRREIRRKELGGKVEARPISIRKNSVSRLTVWTAAMDDQLRRDYPRLPIRQLMASLKVTEPSLRNRAKRLKVYRLPETIIEEARRVTARSGDVAHAR